MKYGGRCWPTHLVIGTEQMGSYLGSFNLHACTYVGSLLLMRVMLALRYEVDWKMDTRFLGP